MAKKNKRTVIGLKCSETGKVNYTLFKPANVTGKLEVMKYSPDLKKHTKHVETKLG
ncbi:50S ribosomal protein L33 [Candidatus Nomurabacteria bacterium]|uniref:Large ribosomal subunit protein bL33 n=1 Tax=Candidatus Dojkabacteria bacterium TaxID=2099670 RepID=A0A955I086_9BACT|nr:50S ribosomal protein L33 [Candidatus Dojkabacteria bacterium]MCB9789747.1 50S ribosomal protein L33 [Candidatus Nomurabacteria bacterium]MCB9803844.1 50S ribosomal protein L33 [Candidatus Nomurabacteria bacterium]